MATLERPRPAAASVATTTTGSPSVRDPSTIVLPSVPTAPLHGGATVRGNQPGTNGTAAVEEEESQILEELGREPLEDEGFDESQERAKAVNGRTNGAQADPSANVNLRINAHQVSALPKDVAASLSSLQLAALLALRDLLNSALARANMSSSSSSEEDRALLRSLLSSLQQLEEAQASPLSSAPETPTTPTSAPGPSAPVSTLPSPSEATPTSHAEVAQKISAFSDSFAQVPVAHLSQLEMDLSTALCALLRAVVHLRRARNPMLGRRARSRPSSFISSGGSIVGAGTRPRSATQTSIFGSFSGVNNGTMGADVFDSLHRSMLSFQQSSSPTSPLDEEGRPTSGNEQARAEEAWAQIDLLLGVVSSLVAQQQAESAAPGDASGDVDPGITVPPRRASMQLPDAGAGGVHVVQEVEEPVESTSDVLGSPLPAPALATPHPGEARLEPRASVDTTVTDTRTLSGSFASAALSGGARSLSLPPSYSYSYELGSQGSVVGVPPAYDSVRLSKELHDLEKAEKASFDEGGAQGTGEKAAMKAGRRSSTATRADRHASWLDAAIAGEGTSTGAALAAERAAARRAEIASLLAQKTMHDLSLVQDAITHLYVVAPQLTNQRVEVSGRKEREMHFLRLGALVDRLGRGGRMEDQRVEMPQSVSAAAAAATRDASAGVATGSGALKEKEAVGASRSSTLSIPNRRMSAPLSLARAASAALSGGPFSKGKEKELSSTAAAAQEEDQIEDILVRLIAVQGRRMGDQRAELGRRQVEAGRKATVERREAMEEREDFLSGLIVRSSSGRLGTQDFVKSGSVPSSQTASRPRFGAQRQTPSAHVQGQENFLSTPMDSQPAKVEDGAGDENPATKKGKASDVSPGGGQPTRIDGVGQQDGEGISADTTIGQRDGGAGSDANDVAPSLRSLAFEHIAESQANVGAITVLVRPVRPGSGNGTDDTATAPVEGELEGEVLPTNPAALQIKHLDTGAVASLLLPSPVAPGQRDRVSFSTDHWTFRLRTVSDRSIDPTGPSSTSSFTSSPGYHQGAAGAPLASFPYSHTYLSRIHPGGLFCISCGLQLADASGVRTYRALPSEHWEELVEAWMCHSDQAVAEGLARGRRGIEEGFGGGGREGEAWVGEKFLVWPRSADRDLERRSMRIEDGSSSSSTPPVVRCRGCDAKVGTLACGVSASTPCPPIRFDKMAIRPSSAEGEPAVPSFPLPLFVSAELLELSQAHAAHHFVVEDEEGGEPRILIWLFNPSLKVSFSLRSGAAHLSALLTEPARAALSGEGAATVNAAKVLFKVLSPSSSSQDVDPLLQTLERGNRQTERLRYPLSRIASLADVLEASNRTYPSSRWSFGPWRVGWLEVWLEGEA